MTFVSYAQNFEDVLLWRALGHLPTGFYIDVGASHPDTDSVTRAFYDRGWHGINVEPTAAAHQRLVAARPRDLNLQLALGATAGELTFYSLDGTNAGLSTLDPAAVARYQARGMAVQAITVPTETLAALCRTHAPPDIHFLKIDVEGAERDVLAGADFAAFRPWLVLAEATAPMSTEETHAEWEPILLDAGYVFLWFDGLNRYYVARERHAELAPHFHTPPNVFDNFLRAADTEWTRRLAEAESRASAVLDRATAAELRAGIAENRAEAANLRLLRTGNEAARLQEVAAARAEVVARLEQENAATAEDRARATRRATEAEAQARVAEATRALSESWLQAMRASTSWRVTAPLRRVAGWRAHAAQAPSTAAPEPDVIAELPMIAAPRPAPPPPIPTRPPAPPRRAVHQFHSGTAVGDAITNAMFLTRRVLRGLGYDSRIFAEHRDPGLGNEIHPLADLPDHDRYVLLLRHSMGHDALDRVLALPAPKVLIYHNITPPELLEGSPFMQRYARIGLDQLAAIRPAVKAVLADSEFSALELRQAGYTDVAACPMLFDLATMMAPTRSDPAPFAPAPSASRAAPRDTALTFLFVGRVTAAKGQVDLVEAYAQFRALHHGPSRLILVGRCDDEPFVQALFAAIRRLGLQHGEVEVTGLVDDAALRRHYADADLYVSMSRHEGFGVPLVEAIAKGVPVLATATGAVPYTIGPDPAGLADGTAAGVAAGMLALAGPAARAALLARQRAGLDRFRLERHIPTLVLALAQAGAARPVDPAAHQALAANARFTVTGHVNGTYSLAEINRSLAAALEAKRPGSVRLIPVEGDVTAEVGGVPPGQRSAVAALVARPPPATAPEIVVSQHYPIWVPLDRGDLALAYVFWEESVLPAPMAAQLNDGFHGVLAPTAVVAKALVESGVTVPVRVVSPAPRLDAFRRLRAERGARPSRPFTFLHVSSCFPRKGVDVLLAAYARAFRAGADVRLVIKGFPNPHNTVAADLARLQASEPGMAPVTLVDADIDEDALLALFGDADAMVLPTRGEGYNLPAAEALAAGLPVITTGWGGHMDFIPGASPGAVRLLRYRFAPSATHLATPFSLWAEPDVDDLVLALQEFAARPPATPGPGFLAEPSPIAGAIADFAAQLLLRPPAPSLPRVGWITTWDVRCGIAEYSRRLVGAVPVPALVLADERTGAAEPSPEPSPNPAPVISPSWRVGDEDSLAGLIGAILRHDPQAVVLQHQPGLVPWTTLPGVLDHPALHGRVCCVTLHNAQDLADAPPPVRAAVTRALVRMSRVVVHSVRDVNVLAALGLAANTVLIPHGAAASAPPQPPRTLAPGDAVLLGCYGFFLPGKGIPQLIDAIGLLRPAWPNLALRLVNAEYPLPQSAEEIAACRARVAAAGLDAAVTFETGFLAHEDSAALLAPCDLLVLPYQHSKEGSSAALRSALQTGVPVATTPLPLFEEAGSAALTLPGIAAASIARGIDGALRDQAARAAAVASAATWLADRNWTTVGERWGAMLQGLAASGVVVQAPALDAAAPEAAHP